MSNCLHVCCWKLWRLSFFGKITVLKSLIASQVAYILLPVPTNQLVMEEQNTLFFNCLWSDMGDKTKQITMINDKGRWSENDRFNSFTARFVRKDFFPAPGFSGFTCSLKSHTSQTLIFPQVKMLQLWNLETTFLDKFSLCTHGHHGDQSHVTFTVQKGFWEK